jgi:hypothetical protein
VNSYDIVPRASFEAARRLLQELAWYDFGKHTVRKRVRFARWGASLISSSAGLLSKGARGTRGAVQALRTKLRCNTTAPVCEATKQSEGSPPEYFLGISDDIWDKIETRSNTIGELAPLDFYYLQSAANGSAVITFEKAEKLRNIELTQWGMVSNHLMGPGSTGQMDGYSETNNYLLPAYAELSDDETRTDGAGRGIINRYIDNLERVARSPWYWPYVRLAEVRAPQLELVSPRAPDKDAAEVLAETPAPVRRGILERLRFWSPGSAGGEASTPEQSPPWWKFWSRRVADPEVELRRRWWQFL